MNRSPFFSIVTACRNDRANLLATARSLAEQTCVDFEWVVVDGASTDGTVEWLRQNPVVATHWKSETDTGIYDAFDKGARRSQGAYIVYICAGDELAGPDTLARVKQFIEENPGRDLYYGDAYDVTAGEVTGLRKARSHETIWWNLFTHHQSMFYARRCFELARYDRTYQIGGDYAFTAEILHKGAQALRMPFVTARFQIGGTSYRNYWQGERDNWRTRRQLGYGLPTRGAIWLAHAAIRVGRVYLPSLYRKARYSPSSQPLLMQARTASGQDEKPLTFDVEGVAVTAAPLEGAVRRIVEAAKGATTMAIFTLNLDHVAKLRSNPRFARAYRSAGLVVPDGFPVALAGRLNLGRRVERVCGSDMIIPLAEEAARAGLPIYLFGATKVTLDNCARRLAAEIPGLKVGGVAPDMGFDPESALADEAISSIAAAGPAIVFVALGAPKAEIFADRLAQRMHGGAVVSIGAGLDFLAGVKKRAPEGWQHAGLEWAWRLMHEPRRLGLRYMRSASVLPSVIGHAWLDNRRSSTGP